MILSNQAYTLADWRAATDDAGNIAPVVNLLSQDNEILLDLLWLQTNGVMEHKTTVMTGLPQAFWRLYNQGVQRSKGTRATVKDTCGMLETYSIVDKDLANLNGQSAAWRLSEDKPFLDGMNQQMASTLFYGNVEVNPERFSGLAARFSTVNTALAASAANVLDAGGAGSTNTSIWVCTWSAQTGHGIYPKGSRAGLVMEDVTTPAPVPDGNGGWYQAMQTHFKWDCGLTIRDWRYFARVANIDVTQLTSQNAPNLISLLTAAVNKFPAMPRRVTSTNMAGPESAGEPVVAMMPAIYCNRTMKTAIDLQAMNKSNVLLKLEEWDGMAVTTFRGIPIRTCDALLNTEARVV